MNIDSYYKPTTLNDVSSQSARARMVPRKKKMEPISYSRLFEVMKHDVLSKNPTSTQRYANLKSALSQYMTALALQSESIVGTELGASFYKLANKHLATLRAHGRKEQSIRDTKSLLQKWHLLNITLQKEYAASTGRLSPFQVRLQEVLPQNIGLKHVAKQAGVSVSALQRWKAGVVPSTRSIAAVRRLETFLALSPGSLVALVQPDSNHSLVPQGLQETIPYRARLASQTASPYRLQIESVRKELRDAWCEFLAYKTAPVSIKYQRSARGAWRIVHRHASNRADAQNRSSFTADGHFVPTAGVAWGHVSSFLGWLNTTANDVGITGDETQNLAWLTDFELVGRYIDWRIARSGNVVHGGLTSFVTFVLTLVHPETGYLTQCTNFRHTLPTPESSQDWQQRCEAAFAKFKKLKNSLKAVEKKSRDPFAPIKTVIELANPLSAIVDMLARLRAARPTPGTIGEAVWGRDILLIKLLISSPLRLKNLQNLTYRADNSGSLYKVNDTWRLRVAADEFKNHKFAASDKQFDIELDVSLNADIRAYLEIFRPYILRSAGRSSERLFVSSKKSLGDEPWKSLSRHVSKLTRLYLLKCPGVGTHAIRHIVATALIKLTGEYSTAAQVLHDEESTVRQSYAHLIPNDGHKKYRALFPEIFRG